MANAIFAPLGLFSLHRCFFFMQTYSIYRTPYKPTHPPRPRPTQNLLTSPHHSTPPHTKTPPHPFNPILAQRSKLFSQQAHRVRLPRQGFPHRKLYVLTIARTTHPVRPISPPRLPLAHTQKRRFTALLSPHSAA